MSVIKVCTPNKQLANIIVDKDKVKRATIKYNINLIANIILNPS